MPMQLVRAGLTLGLSTAARMVANFAVVKTIALYLGTGGMGYVGQFMSVVTLTVSLAGGGISMGLTKYVAEQDANRRSAVPHMRAASVIWLGTALVFFLAMTAGATRLSQALFDTPDYWPVFWGVAICEFAIGAGNLLVAVINGKRDVSGVALVNTLSAISAAVITCALVAFAGFGGALWGLILGPCTGVLFAGVVAWKRKYLQVEWGAHRALPQHYRELLVFTAMQVATVCTMPTVQIVLRKWQGEALGWDQVGVWQGLVKLSDAWIQFATVVLANHYYPRLARMADRASVHREFRATLLASAAALVPAAVAIWLLREPIIRILFAPGFLPMEHLLAPQLAGDVLRTLSYVAVYVAVAKGNARIYIAGEIFQATLLMLLSYFFIPAFASRGVPYAYCATYALYCAICLAGYWRYRRAQSQAGA